MAKVNYQHIMINAVVSAVVSLGVALGTVGLVTTAQEQSRQTANLPKTNERIDSLTKRYEAEKLNTKDARKAIDERVTRLSESGDEARARDRDEYVERFQAIERSLWEHVTGHHGVKAAR